MLENFDEFFRFCFEHGGTLRNHKQFGEMAQALRAQIEAAEQPRAVDASPDMCEHGFMRGNCYVEICSFSKYGERN